MLPFNESRQKGVDILKAYCRKVTEVPDPQEYYATVANLPVREDVRNMIFHNTCVTISPNQLYTVTRLIDSTKERIVIPSFFNISESRGAHLSLSLDSEVSSAELLPGQARPHPQQC